MNIDNSNLSFKAYKIASTKNVYKTLSTNIDLYRLSKFDKSNIDLIEKEINIEDNLKNINEYDRKRWKRVFLYTLDSAKDPDSDVILAISKGKPCGIMSFFYNDRDIFLDAICDIPLKNSKRVNYTGSTLFYQLFKLANEFKAKCINLLAVANGPIDVVSKYQAKGFKPIGMEDEYVKMSCNKYKIKEQLNELSSNIHYKEILKAKDISLKDLII